LDDGLRNRSFGWSDISDIHTRQKQCIDNNLYNRINIWKGKAKSQREKEIELIGI